MMSRYARYLCLLAGLLLLAVVSPVGAQSTDYDADNNGLIDIRTLAQLNAIRWDLNGDGALDASADTTAYQNAFSNAVAGMGCPSTGCIGYELKADLDFDTNNDGTVDGTDPNSYANWTPIGGTYSATFDGNHHTIANLTINTTGNAALFHFVSGTIREVGMKDVNIRSSGPSIGVAALVFRITSTGTVLACWSSGSVTTTGIESEASGLVFSVRGRLAASYSSASVESTNDRAGGLSTSMIGGVIVACYAIGDVRGDDPAGFLYENVSGTIRASYAGNSSVGRYWVE